MQQTQKKYRRASIKDSQQANIAENLKVVAKDIYSRHPNSPIGVLDARKELDNWLELTDLERLLVRDAPQTAQVESVRAIRRAMSPASANIHQLNSVL